MQHKIKQVVERLRQQPEEHKRHILHSVTIVAGVILFVLWTWNLGSSLSSEELQAKLKADLEPFAQLQDSVAESYQSANIIDSQQE